MLYGKEVSNPPSRFIKEIDDSLLEIQNAAMMEKEKINVADMYNENGTDFKKGDIVMHTIYGRGVVVDIQGDLVSIAFAKNYGVKKLLKNHKSLRKMG